MTETAISDSLQGIGVALIALGFLAKIDRVSEHEGVE